MSNIKDERELLSPPGDTILETIAYMKMSQAELAQRMGKTPSKVNDLISGKEPITMNTALQLENVLGIDAQFWLNREIQYREKLSRLDQEEFLETCKGWLKEQPVKELRNYGYIKSERADASMVNELLKFYAVDTPVQWQSLYVDEYVNASFRKSEAHKTTLGSMAAWLRIGEIELKRMKLPPYDKDKFKKALQQVKVLVKEHPEDYPDQLQRICAAAGVAVVFTINLPKAPINGATRWIGGTPLIQMTDRYKFNDIFWFTFFHEAGHILLHGKKDVFIEDFDAYTMDKAKEEEANRFAAEWLLPVDFLSQMPEGSVTAKDIRRVARAFDTHPAIVLGRMSRMNRDVYHLGPELRLRVDLEYFIRRGREK